MSGTHLYLPTPPATPLTGELHLSSFHFSNTDAFPNRAVKSVGFAAENQGMGCFGITVQFPVPAEADILSDQSAPFHTGLPDP